MSAAWFVDGAYAMKCWGSLKRTDKLDYMKLRQFIESRFLDQTVNEKIEDAYYFNADPEPPTAKQNAFHNALQYPPPGGPGLRVKLYWLQEKELFWPAHMGGSSVVHPVTGEHYKQTIQKAVDVGLAFHLMRSFSKRRWGTLFFFAGDSDFHEAIQHLVEHEDVNLVLIGTLQTISQELRPYARNIVEIDKQAAQISRP
jgi:uncharacterized LabA/DUF88 family protein